MRLLVEYVCLSLFFIIFSQSLPAQPVSPADSAILSAAVRSSGLQYQQFIGKSAPLYSGLQYVEYVSRINEGHPFLLQPDFVKGTVMYDNILYENVDLMFDLLRNRVVVKDASGLFRLTPDPEKISRFTLGDHLFVKPEADNELLSKSNFYEVLYTSNRLTLLKKENKKLDEAMNPPGVPGLKRTVLSSTDFYIKKHGVYYRLNRSRQILAVFKDRKTEIRQLMRQKDFRLKTDPDAALVRLVVYYDSLQ